MVELGQTHILIKTGALNCQVCSLSTIDEALEWVRDHSPAGTQHNWQIDDRECVKPVRCKEDQNRMHYIFIC